MTGCSVDSAQSPQGNSGVSDINSRAPATLRQGGNLNLAISELPRNFNPLHVDADADYIDMAKASYPRAFVLGRDGQPALNTAYFTSVEVDKDDDQLERDRRWAWAVAKSINEAREARSFPVQPGDFTCPYCPFQVVCDQGQSFLRARPDKGERVNR